MTKHYALNSDTFAAQTFPEEVIVLDVHNGTYFALSGNAPAAWHALISGVDVDAFATTIAEATGHEPSAVAADLNDFVALLVSDTILSTAAGVGIAAKPTGGDLAAQTKYTGFVREKHADLDELLVLAPVHDVDPRRGWPHGQ